MQPNPRWRRRRRRGEAGTGPWPRGPSTSARARCIGPRRTDVSGLGTDSMQKSGMKWIGCDAVGDIGTSCRESLSGKRQSFTGERCRKLQARPVTTARAPPQAELWAAVDAALAGARAGVVVGLGRSVALYYCASASHRIRSRIRCQKFPKRQCDRTLGGLQPAARALPPRRARTLRRL